MTQEKAEPYYGNDILNSNHSDTIQSELHESGMRVDRLRVQDGYEIYSGRDQVQGVIDSINQELIEHPDWLPPSLDSSTQQIIINNPASALLYGDSDTLQGWFVDAANARATALYPLQRPNIDTLPGGGIIDDVSRGFFYHGLDAIGIRTRAKIMSEIAARNLQNQPGARWVSLACGAAVPVVDALKECQSTELVHLDLIDMNPDALEFASELAENEAGLSRVPCFVNEHKLRSYTTHKMNLLRGLIVDDELVQEFGEDCSDMVDALGIFEYFSHKHSVRFLKNAYRLVRSDGVLVIANMLADRPQMDFNERGVGWPKLYPRSIDEIVSIITEAGIDPVNARIMVPEDSVYAVVEIRK